MENKTKHSLMQEAKQYNSGQKQRDIKFFFVILYRLTSMLCSDSSKRWTLFHHADDCGMCEGQKNQNVLFY